MKDKEILEKNQLRLSVPGKDLMLIARLLRIGRIASNRIEIQIPPKGAARNEKKGTMTYCPTEAARIAFRL